MRYYKIDLLDPDSGDVKRTFTSLNNDGSTNPGALTIEMDVLVGPYATPLGDAGSYVRIWGISLQDISSASDFNGYGIAVYGGMAKGLPLANPSQAGLLFRGSILQAFGNWVDTDQTLDFYVLAAVDPKTPVANLTLNWKQGQNLGDAVQQTLSTAFPGYSANVQVDETLKRNYDQSGYYSNIVQFAELVKAVSIDIKGPDYPGVDIILTDKTFNVYDGTTAKTPIQIQFQDMIGQPTWIESPTMQFKAVMRADLHVGDFIKMPNAVYTTTQQANSFAIDDKSAFQGSFMITSIRHVGSFRQPDAASWATIIESAPQNLQSAQQ